ncbi:MAG: tetratricopeptide repeat protein [Verrucomicrobiae bacterium]|nr:tetratricopeptide repeat protein [Verrucomicrobiae bacterium]
MTPLPPPHQHRLNAAEGWLALGLPSEALAELDALPEVLRRESAVLDAEFAVHTLQGNWQSAFEIAARHTEWHPDDSGAWIHRAYAARRRPEGGLDEAFRLLLPAADRFPAEGVIPYNLACYCAQQHQLDDAWHWLTRAARISGVERIRRMAANDPDLEALHARLEDLG